MGRSPLIVICGPTAVGKSRVAVSLAEGRGEIISADSMQVYKFFNIGTAKPDGGLLKQVKHHLISIVEPDVEASCQRIHEGFQFIAYSADVRMLDRSCRVGIKTIWNAVEKIRERI